jgi:murein DD-endopeptidase MepM/ murein hydrolase activator NlpD
LEGNQVNRKAIVALATLLLVGVPVVVVQAQSGGPSSQMTASQTTVHIVQRGETLFSIAQRYGMTVDAITHANGISDPRKIYAGQRLIIPGGKRDTSMVETVPYIIQAGDTLASIARCYHTTWQMLVQVNDLLAPSVIHAGQVVQVPALDKSASEEGIAHPAMEGGVVYIVHPDDTLFHIALRYGVSPWTLAAVSHVANPALIFPGQELVIPGEGPGLLPAPFSYVEVQPLPVTQGTVMVVAVCTTEPITLEGRLFGQELRFAMEKDVYYGLVGVHVFTEPGLYELELTAVDGRGRRIAITTGVLVEAGRFGYERIDVPVSRTGLLDPAVFAGDRERFDAVRSIFTPERLWTVPFQRPCGGTISAYFGSHRSYNGGPYTSYHSGVDFRAPSGTPVYAAAAGTVVLAEPMALWGNAVVIDHGWGVLTGYGHLSKIDVQVGQQVLQGEPIARVGNTGLSTGSHLHWETWVSGNSVNGLQWLEESYPWPEAGQLAIGG